MTLRIPCRALVTDEQTVAAVSVTVWSQTFALGRKRQHSTARKEARTATGGGAQIGNARSRREDAFVLLHAHRLLSGRSQHLKRCCYAADAAIGTRRGPLVCHHDSGPEARALPHGSTVVKAGVLPHYSGRGRSFPAIALHVVSTKPRGRGLSPEQRERERGATYHT